MTLPAWLTQAAPTEPPGLRTVTPSSASDGDDARPPAGAGVSAALLRGSLTHRLLQALPDISAERRLAAAQGYLDRAGGELDAEQRAAIAEQVMRVLDDASFHEAFQPGSRAEVPIVGKIMSAARWSASPARSTGWRSPIRPFSFATSRPTAPPPRRIEDVPSGYIRQLALYRAVLAKLYPGRTIRAALLWTEAPDIMELSGAALDAALVRVTSA